MCGRYRVPHGCIKYFIEHICWLVINTPMWKPHKTAITFCGRILNHCSEYCRITEAKIVSYHRLLGIGVCVCVGGGGGGGGGGVISDNKNVRHLHTPA